MRPAAKNALKHSDIYMEEQQLDHVSYTNSTGNPMSILSENSIWLLKLFPQKPF